MTRIDDDAMVMLARDIVDRALELAEIVREARLLRMDVDHAKLRRLCEEVGDMIDVIEESILLTQEEDDE